MTLYERAYSRSENWKVIAISLGLLMTLAIAEWFVTYCAFSSSCPMADKIAVWTVGQMPLDRMMMWFGT